MKILFSEKHITHDNNYIIIYLKTGANIELQDYLRGIYIMRAKVKEYAVYFLKL